MKESFKKYIIWSHRRGSIQYDILCILILAFIFLIPRGCFVRDKSEPSEKTGRQTVEETQSEIKN